MKKIISTIILLLSPYVANADVPEHGAPVAANFLHDNLIFIWHKSPQISVLCCAVLLLFLYYAVFFIVNRTLKMPAAVPLFKAPENLSAAACRYLLNMRYDSKVLTTTLIEFALKGYLKISRNNSGKYFLERMPNNKPNDLATLEQQSLNDIFDSASKISIDSLKDAELVFMHRIKVTYNKTILNNNISVLVKGVLICLLSFLIVDAIPGAINYHEIFIQIMLYTATLSILLFSKKSLMPGLTKYKNFSLLSILKLALKTVLMSTIIIFLILLMLAFTAKNGHDLAMDFITLTMVFINYMASFFLVRPTAEGQKLRSEIKGFQMFLAESEANHLKLVDAQKTTPELLNEYFPYAYALDIIQPKSSHLFRSLLSPFGQHADPSANNCNIADLITQVTSALKVSKFLKDD